MPVRYFFIIVGVILSGLFFPANGQSSNPSIDSLSQTWYYPPAVLNDSLLLVLGNDLAGHYHDYNYDSLLSVAQGIGIRGVRKQNQLWVNYSRFWCGVYYHLRGQTDSAIHNLTYAAVHSSPSDIIKAFSYDRLGAVYAESGQKDSAFYCYKMVITLGKQYQFEQKKPGLYAGAYYDLGGLYAMEGKYIAALTYYSKAKDIILFSGIPITRYGAIQTGILFKKLGLYDQSKACYEEALTYPPNNKTLVSTLRNIRQLITIAPNLKEVRKLTEQGMSIIDTTHIPGPALQFFKAAGSAYMDSCHYDKAEFYFVKALGLASDLHQGLVEAELKLYLSEIDAQHRRYSQSLKKCRQIQALIEKNNTTDQLVLLYDVMSRDFEHLGQPDSALYYLKRHNQEALKISSKEALKENISAYLEYKTEEERKALEAEKTAAEKKAADSKFRTVFVLILSAFIIFLLLGAGIVSNSYYRQKMHLMAELENLNATLRSEHAKLLMSNKKLRHFSSVISHDVLSSLDLILSAGNLISVERERKDQLHLYYKLSQQTYRNLKKYCIDLLQQTKFTHLTATGLFDPNPVVAEVFSQFEWAIKEKGIVVDLQQLPPTPLPPVHITQFFYNIITNVLRYASDQSNPELRISGFHDEAGNANWMITDNGPGISPGKWNEIVKNGKTSSAKGEGMGLGQIIDTLHQYGAELFLTTPENGGTRFTITFSSPN